MNQIKNKKCIVCLNSFEYKTETNRATIKVYRGKNMLTCSPKCSKVYKRISEHIQNTKKFKKKKESIEKIIKGYGKSRGLK